MSTGDVLVLEKLEQELWNKHIWNAYINYPTMAQGEWLDATFKGRTIFDGTSFGGVQFLNDFTLTSGNLKIAASSVPISEFRSYREARLLTTTNTFPGQPTGLVLALLATLRSSSRESADRLL